MTRKLKAASAALLALLLLPTLAQAFNLRKAIDVPGPGAQVAVTGVAGKVTRLHGFDLTLSGVSTIQWKCASTNMTGVMTLNAWSKPLSEEPYIACDTGQDLSFTLGGAVQAAGILYYRQD